MYYRMHLKFCIPNRDWNQSLWTLVSGRRNNRDDKLKLFHEKIIQWISKRGRWLLATHRDTLIPITTLFSEINPDLLYDCKNMDKTYNEFKWRAKAIGSKSSFARLKTIQQNIDPFNLYIIAYNLFRSLTSLLCFSFSTRRKLIYDFVSKRMTEEKEKLSAKHQTLNNIQLVVSWNRKVISGAMLSAHSFQFQMHIEQQTPNT